MTSVSVKDLTLNFGSISVLKSLNIDVADGEFLVLLGPSGCGKSTLLNCIAGLLDVSGGQIFIKGKNVTWEEPKDRGIGMVFQSYALYPQMTVEGNLSFGLKTRAPAQGRDRHAHCARRRDPPDRAADEAQAGRTVRRPAPARRHRPGAGARRRRLPLRRAALQPRRQAALRTARRDQAAASASCQYHDLCHPRSDRGDDARRPHRGHVWRRRSSSSTRRRRSTTGRSIASSPASSARPA